MITTTPWHQFSYSYALFLVAYDKSIPHNDNIQKLENLLVINNNHDPNKVIFFSYELSNIVKSVLFKGLNFSVMSL